IFLANSPRINPFFTQNTIAKINNFFAKTKTFFVFDFFQRKDNQQKIKQQDNFTRQQFSNQGFSLNETPQEIKEVISKAPMKKIAPGVYAGEYKGYQVSTIKTNEMEFLEYIFNIRGKKIKIKVPKGQDPPNQKTVEEIFK
ncbi:MAG: hypothetical protein NZM02_01680, partial [Patescibacteria group bacterium]|nr:hypothetical protein [Patescibacteria group bacterium]